MTKYYIYLFGLITLFLKFDFNSAVLENVAVVFRHGARPPVDFNYPENALKLDLTNEGKLQGFNLGLSLRHRYRHFLSKQYIVDEIYTRSSDVDRCLMTSETVLAGLYYPPSRADDWSGKLNLKWTPIPVHTSLPGEDEILYGNRSSYCPKMAAHISKIISEYFQSNPQLEKTLNIHPNEDEYSLLVKVTTALKTNRSENDYLTRELFDYAFADQEFRKLTAGPLLKDIQENMNPPPLRKVTLYSTHDVVIWALLETLDFEEKPDVVNFVSTLLFELHVEDDGEVRLDDSSSESKSSEDSSEESKSSNKDSSNESKGSKSSKDSSNESKGSKSSKDSSNESKSSKSSKDSSNESKGSKSSKDSSNESKSSKSSKESSNESKSSKSSKDSSNESKSSKSSSENSSNESKNKEKKTYPKESKRYVRIVFKNGLDAKYKVQKLRDCKELCPLEQFNTILAPYIPSLWRKECQL